MEFKQEIILVLRNKVTDKNVKVRNACFKNLDGDIGATMNNGKPEIPGDPLRVADMALSLIDVTKEEV